MQDLNDKITGGSLLAAEWNEVPSEIQNVIEGLGLTLSAGDLNQLGKAIAGYTANGDFYTDSGAADAYVLTTIGAKQSPPAYTDGFQAVFKADNANTGATTVNVAGLGVVNVFNAGAALTGGEVLAGARIVIEYDLANTRFNLIRSPSGSFVSNANGNPNNDDTIFDVSALTEATWSEIGPTGAANVWSPLNSVPDGVDWIEVKVYMFASGGANSTATFTNSYVRADGGTEAAAIDNLSGSAQYYTDAAGDGRDASLMTIKIPVTDKKFEIQWTDSALSTPAVNTIDLILVGYGNN